MSMQPNESIVFLAAITIMTSVGKDGSFYTLKEAVKIARVELREFQEKHRRHDADEMREAALSQKEIDDTLLDAIPRKGTPT